VTAQAEQDVTAMRAPSHEDVSEADHYVEALRRFRGDVRMMEQVLATMIERGEPRSAAHLGLMLDEYLASRSLRKARAIIEQMQLAGHPLEARHQYDIAIAMAAAGEQDAALATFEQLVAEQRDPTAAQAAFVLSLLVAARRLQLAWPLYRRMRAREQHAERATQLLLLADCLERRAAKDTLTVVRGMLAAGHAVPAARVVAGVRMLVGIGQLERAVELLALAAEAGAVSGASSADAHGMVLQALARKGRVDDCLAIVARLAHDGGPSSHHRNALLEARIVAGDLDGAWADAEAMWADAGLPTGANLERLLDLTMAAGNVARAAGLLDLLLVIGVPVPPHRSGAVLRAELAADGMARVLPMAERLLELGAVFDRATARDLVERLVRSRRLDDARAWLARFRASGTLTQGRSYGSLLQALVAAKQADAAVTLLEEMVAARIAPVATDVTRLVTGRLRAGDLGTAGRILDAAARAAVHVDEPTLRELMWAHARKGELAQVDRTIERLVAAGVEPDERHEKARAWASGATPRRLEDTPEGTEPDGTEPPAVVLEVTDASSDATSDATSAERD
jgi:pentatricopeptide repeat protein